MPANKRKAPSTTSSAKRSRDKTTKRLLELEMEASSLRQRYDSLMIETTKGLYRRSNEQESNRKNVLKRLRTMVDSGATPADVKREMASYAHAYSDFGDGRRKKVLFHLHRLESLLEPTEVSKLLICLNRFGRTREEAIGGGDSPAGADDSTREVVRYMDLAHTLKSTSSSASMVSSSGSADDRDDRIVDSMNEQELMEELHNNNDSAESMYDGNLIVSDVFENLSKTLQLTKAQHDAFVEAALAERESDAKSAVSTLHALWDFYEQRASTMRQTMGKVMKIINPLQQARYVLWLEENLAIPMMLAEEYKEH